MCQKQGAIKMNPLLLTHSILVMDYPAAGAAGGVAYFLLAGDRQSYFSLFISAFTAFVTSVLSVSLM